MRPMPVVEGRVAINAGLSLDGAILGVQIDLLVFG